MKELLGILVGIIIAVALAKPLFPFPDRLSSVFFALGGKVISEHSSPIRSTCQLLCDGDCALAIDRDGE
jgi:hypothetical protein